MSTTAATTTAPPPPPLTGLSAEQATARLATYGANELAAAPRMSVAREIARSLVNPLMLILLAASAVAAGVGEVVDAMIIVSTVVLGVALDAIQTSRSHAAVERLRSSIVPTATVWRDARWQEIARRDLVPGDVIHLSAGDVVPADARLVIVRDLHVQQSALTGESLPAEKAAPPGEPADKPIPPKDPNDPDAVFLGTSVVSGIGIAVVVTTGSATAFGAIAARLRDAPPPTEFERGLHRFGALLAQTVIFLMLFLVLVSVALHREPLESLLFAVALAVGLVPEFMPMVTSITLATGAARMARRRVIVKHLGAIQNFGSIDVLCSDKTGTLTRGEMQVVSATNPRCADDAGVLALAAAAARLHSGIRNPLDDAVIAAAPNDPGWEKLDEIPFDFERRRVSVALSRNGQRLLVVRGAPEHVLAACTTVADGDRVIPLDAGARDTAMASIRRNGEAGLRTIAVATRELDPRDAYSREDERELTFAGWLTFADPPLPDADEMVAALARDGVQLKILTGDDEAVARHVCEAAGIDATHTIVGSALDDVTDSALGAVAERTVLFARVSPQQKLRVLLALKARGHVVGYIGDGINDAPSLHAADVGISVGGAVDIAKDAADIVLMDRGLDVLHAGMIEGRKAFGNVMKYLLMGTSSNFGNMFSMAVASLVVPFLPLLPTQILLNNFLYDFSQIAIPTDNVDDAYVRKPRHWDMRVLRQFMIRIGLVSSLFDFMTFGVLLLVLRASPPIFRTGWFIESIVTQTLVLLVIRTTGNPLRSRPSALLASTVALTVVVGVALPFTPLSRVLGFETPPPVFLAFVVVATACYLAAVEVAKRRLVPRLLG
jgi:P-type Mg2+ transporter